jgi:hypothetical protein
MIVDWIALSPIPARTKVSNWSFCFQLLEGAKGYLL